MDGGTRSEVHQLAGTSDTGLFGRRTGETSDRTGEAHIEPERLLSAFELANTTDQGFQKCGFIGREAIDAHTADQGQADERDGSSGKLGYAVDEPCE
jgi:hypothetical protein